MGELLLIAGTGKNSGKTTMACAVIRNLSKHQHVVGVKVTPHYHENYNFRRKLVDRNDLVIAEESQIDTGKDSSRMLKAGALQVYFVMAKDEQLIEAMQFIAAMNIQCLPVICESGGVIHYFKPGLFLVMTRADETDIKPEYDYLLTSAHHLISFDGNVPDFDTETITYSDKKWKIEPKN